MKKNLYSVGLSYLPNRLNRYLDLLLIFIIYNSLYYVHRFIMLWSQIHYLSVLEVFNIVTPVTTAVIREVITIVRITMSIESEISKLLWTGFLVQITKDCQTVYRRVWSDVNWKWHSSHRSIPHSLIHFSKHVRCILPTDPIKTNKIFLLL